MPSLSSMTPKSEKHNLYAGDEHAKNYRQFRPTYPDVVFETIFNSCKKNATGNDLALDIGCGSGQSTLPLVKYFSKVIGIDVSPAQISNAPTNVPGVTFHVSSAEELGVVEDESVDLITIGQALHWIPFDRFYAEVDRILKPGGSIAAYSYDVMYLDHIEANDYLWDVYRAHLSKYWSEDRRHIGNRYSMIPSPYSDWSKYDDVFDLYWTPEHLVGYMKTWGMSQTFKKDNPNSDLFEKLEEKLSLFCHEDGRKTFKATFPFFMRMSHKPRSAI